MKTHRICIVLSQTDSTIIKMLILVILQWKKRQLKDVLAIACSYVGGWGRGVQPDVLVCVL